MEMALVALAGIGILVFLFSYFAFIFAGFKHHPITGIISMLPVLNVVTLPSLWHKVGRKLIIGFIGLLIAVASWMFGAEQGFNNLSNRAQGKAIEGTNLSNSQQATQAQTLLESDMQGLPSKAIYKMAFKSIDIDKLGTLQGKTIRILTKESELIEGRLAKIINTKASVESANNVTKEVSIDNIEQLSVMLKQAQ